MDVQSSAPSDEDEATSASFVDRLRALDHHAWAELYDLQHGRIWRYAFGRTGSRDAAGEVAAQVFAEALSSIHRYRYKDRPVLAWLYGIARNLAAKQARRRRRDDAGRYVEPSGGSLEERLDSLDLAEALQRLTAEQREVVALRFFAGYSTREIALAMGKREPAVYSLEVRAIGALRRQLAQNTEKLTPKADENGVPPGIDKVR